MIKNALRVMLAFCCFLTLQITFTSFARASSEGLHYLIRDIKVENGYMVAFNPEVLTYTVELYGGETYANIIVSPIDESYAVQIDGNEAEWIPGEERTVTVTVYDWSGNSDTYYLNISVPDESSMIRFMQCLNGTMTPQFRSSAQTYYFLLPNQESQIKLDIRTVDPNARTELYGNENLPEGRRKHLTLSVYDSVGRSEIYQLYVYRESPIAANINSNCLLKSLQLNSGAVDFIFNSKQFYYKLPVSKSISEIFVSATAESRENVVEIVGNRILSDDHANILTLIVYNPDRGFTPKSVYTLELYHDTLRTHPKFSMLQMIVGVLTSALCAVLLMFLIEKRRTVLIRTQANPPHTTPPGKPYNANDSAKTSDSGAASTEQIPVENPDENPKEEDADK